MKTSPLTASPSLKRLKLAAFTLIELLVVISIIAVLAGILLPVTGAVMENAKKTSAKSTEQQIITAVKSFQTEYGVYPNIPNVTQNGTDTTVGGTSTNAGLFNILRATGLGSDVPATSPNTRRIVFFEGKDVKTLSKPKDGFIPSTGTAGSGNNGVALASGDLVDPWGNLYFVRYDSGYTDAVIHPYADSSSTANDASGSTTNLLRFGVVAWSYGKDGKQGLNNSNLGAYPSYNYGDDVVSWQ